LEWAEIACSNSLLLPKPKEIFDLCRMAMTFFASRKYKKNNTDENRAVTGIIIF
jgi:hypothetical protein